MTKDQAQKALVNAMQDLILVQKNACEVQRTVITATEVLQRMLMPKESADLPNVPETYFGNIKIRPQVAWFAGRMEQKLRANDHKGGWEDDYLDALFKRLLEEVEELRREVKERNGLSIIDEAVDVANFCMMLADRVRE